MAKAKKHTRVNFGSFEPSDIVQATIHRRQRDDGTNYFAIQFVFRVTDASGLTEVLPPFAWEKEIAGAQLASLVTQADLDAATADLATKLGGDGIYDGDAPPAQ